MVAAALRAKQATPTRVDTYVTSLRGGMSGGSPGWG
jgi:hypothetical protein